MSTPQLRPFGDVGTLVDALAEALLVEAEAAIAERGAFHLVLAGGSTSTALYAALAERNAGDARWRVWYGDERCVPAGDPERNSRMAETAWLAGSRIPPDHRRPIPAEHGAADAAARYAAWLAAAPDFDVVLLGMGEDGHTASLFPGHEWGGEADSPDVLVVFDSPKPPPERVSLSAARLNRSRHVWFIVTGQNKRTAMQRWEACEPLPVAAIQGREETVVWLDAAAWPGD